MAFPEVVFTSKLAQNSMPQTKFSLHLRLFEPAPLVGTTTPCTPLHSAERQMAPEIFSRPVILSKSNINGTSPDSKAAVTTLESTAKFTEETKATGSLVIFAWSRVVLSFSQSEPFE